MITLTHKKINSLGENIEITQAIYDALINLLDLNDLRCSCNQDHCLSKHAYYHRKVKTSNGILSLRILRVKCSHCNRTHAILLSCIIPYSQILLAQLLDIIKKPMNALHSVMVSHDLDDAHIRLIKNKFSQYWKESLKIRKFDLDVHLPSLCFSHFKRQFMQMSNGINLPFYLHNEAFSFLFGITT